MTDLSHGLELFLSEIEPRPDQVEQIRQRRERLRQVANALWATDDLFHSDAFGRSTQIRPLVEVELYLVLNGPACQQQARSKGPAALLAEMHAALRSHYAGVRVDLGPRDLSIAHSEFPLRVVPAFLEHRKGYLVPDAPSGAWLAARPDRRIEFVRRAAEYSGGRALGLVKMLVAWSRHRGLGLEAFHLEVMGLRVLSSAPEDQARGLAQALEGTARLVLEPCADPTGLERVLDAYLRAEARQAVAATASQDARLLRKAMVHDQAHEHEEALRIAGEILGEGVPAR